MELKVVLTKEVETIEQAQTLYDRLKELIAPQDPIDKRARVIQNIILED